MLRRSDAPLTTANGDGARLGASELPPGLRPIDASGAVMLFTPGCGAGGRSLGDGETSGFRSLPRSFTLGMLAIFGREASERWSDGETPLSDFLLDGGGGGAGAPVSR